MNDFSRMLQPGNWGSLELPNRTFMPPMGTGTANPDGTASDTTLAYYLARAKGGTGIVITESMQVSTKFEPKITGPLMTSDDHIPAWQRGVREIHRVGGHVAGNLTIGLGRIYPVGADGGTPYSASEISVFYNPEATCRSYTLEQIEELLHDFRLATRRVLEAGFDALDIHAHTGYLADQFFSEQWNHRTDAYGGSLENRMRIGVDMVRIVREEAGDDYPLSMRISGSHHYPGGRTTEEIKPMARILADAGLDVLLVDAGSYEALDWAFPPYYLGDGVYLPDAAAAKEAIDIPVAVCGNLTPALAEQALADGITDFVGFGRMVIADPELVNKVKAGRADAVRPCIRCNGCLEFEGEHYGLSCSVNAEAGRELDRVLTPAANPRRVTIVGAGPAGLEAARVAALRGHHVDVYDKAGAIGGVLEPAASPDFKRELRRLVDWWEGQLKDLDVTVHLGHEVGPDSPEVREAEAVVVATGSVPLTPSIPGIDGPNVFDVLDFHRGAPTGDRVVVCGGGLSGADSALELAQAGKQVTLVEMADDIARDMGEHNRVALLRLLAETGVTVMTCHTVTAIDPDGICTQGPEGEVRIAADTVITSFGVRANTALGDALRDAKTAVYVVGDCVQPAKVKDAVHSGYLAAAAI